MGSHVAEPPFVTAASMSIVPGLDSDAGDRAVMAQARPSARRLSSTAAPPLVRKNVRVLRRNTRVSAIQAAVVWPLARNSSNSSSDTRSGGELNSATSIRAKHSLRLAHRAWTSTSFSTTLYVRISNCENGDFE